VHTCMRFESKDLNRIAGCWECVSQGSGKPFSKMVTTIYSLNNCLNISRMLNFNFCLFDAFINLSHSVFICIFSKKKWQVPNDF
jgi:hypothetical protein